MELFKKAFYISGRNFPISKNKKKTYSEKVSYISGKWNFLATNLKNSYIFSKKKFLLFQEGTCKARKTKNSLFFLEKKFSPDFAITADEAVKYKISYNAG